MKKNHPILLIVLFSLGWAFMYADRNILSPVMGTIQSEWGLSKSELGLMSTVFFITYAFMQIPAGFLADRFGRLKILVSGYVLFGIGTFLSGLAPGFLVFLLVRALTGLGEGTYYGPQYGISSNSIPKKYRGISSAMINSGMALGISLGFIASSYFTFTLKKDWQFSFYLFGILTVFVAALIGIFIKDTKNHTTHLQEPSNFHEIQNIRVLFSRNHILTYILIFCSLYGFFSMMTWLPYYLQTARGIDASKTGIIASLVPWASIPGAIFFGHLSDQVKNKKPLILVLALCGAICQFMIPYVHSYFLMLAGLVIYGLIGKLALDPVLISFVADNTPAHMYARAYGIFNFAGMLSSIFSPYITGYFAELTGKIEIGFYISGILLLAGSFLFLLAQTKYSMSAMRVKNIELDYTDISK
ncbi:MFS transporter [Heyndrickxia coagulans]|uniref:MFS transporter n=1 Tax=Heyndrickxia coagulans TaxID=1398 RepID=UPI000E48DC9D|nr:MFS transporter [Heyndrickxia coagulans]MED4407024.1 MFS transporter [Heyndrickxia coagulans]RGR82556.1 MFS transporter [Heyndrickxia coagulans]RGR98379.1 MFS transporter [Heyndrickxia coagulans]